MQLKINRIYIYIALQVVVALLYYLGSLIVLFDTYTVPLTVVDYYIKPHFLAVWIYLSFFLLLFLTVYLSNKKNNILFVKLIIINSIISLIIFIFYPTFIIDTDYYILQKNSPISFKVLSFIIEADVRSNCFPSLHVANSLLATIFLFRIKNKVITLTSTIWFCLIVWSVISTGQHYFYDVLGGVLLSIISYNGLKYFELVKIQKRLKSKK